jgi:formylglycine-generating enzyme required for sulfatase activity
MKTATVLVTFLAAASLRAAVIQQVIVRQQWPWSTDVKVEYKLAEVTAPVDISVKAFNGETELPLPAEAVSGDLYGISESGIGQFIIDPVKAFGNTKVAIADFRVELELSESAANINEVLYKIFCLTNNNDCVDITRKDILNGKYGSYETDFAKLGDGFKTPLADVLVWTGVTNNIDYKTTHLVMRKIPAGGVVWKSGDDAAALAHRLGRADELYIKLTQDFFIGVFELTQDQYTKIYGSNPSTFKEADDSPYRPAENFARFTIHGNPNPQGTKGVITGEPVAWPTNSYLHDVGLNTVLDQLRKRTGVEFDLPMAAQWEFACRAGSTNALYSGKLQTTASVNELAWNEQNSGNTTHVVGTKAPNAYGIYDILGNVSEFVHDINMPESTTPYSGGIGSGATEQDPMVDPLGIDDAAAVHKYDKNRYERGGSWNSADGWWEDLRAGSACNYYQWTWNGSYVGARLVCPVGAQWSAH